MISSLLHGINLTYKKLIHESFKNWGVEINFVREEYLSSESKVQRMEVRTFRVLRCIFN